MASSIGAAPEMLKDAGHPDPFSASRPGSIFKGCYKPGFPRLCGDTRGK